MRFRPVQFAWHSAKTLHCVQELSKKSRLTEAEVHLSIFLAFGKMWMYIIDSSLRIFAVWDHWLFVHSLFVTVNL